MRHGLSAPLSRTGYTRRWQTRPLTGPNGAKAYQAAGLNLINKQVLNLVTPEDLNPKS